MSTRPLTQGISSIVKSIDCLTFRALPKEKALDVVKVARHANTTIYLGADGKMYSAGINFSGHYAMGRGRFDDYLRCAVKLGKITAADLKRHFKDCDVADEARRKARLATAFLRYAKETGIELTKAQVAKLEALKK